MKIALYQDKLWNVNNPRPILKLSFDVKPMGHLFEMCRHEK